MITEKDYLDELDHVIKTKKQYLAARLEKEGRSFLACVEDDSWSEKERIQQYEEEVVPFWSKYGSVPERFWFELNGSRDHLMDPRFIPDDLYYNEIVPYLNYGLQRYGLMNKAYYDYFFSDVKMPKTVALKIEGTYCDEKRNIIRVEDAIGRCRERNGMLFLKKSIDSHSGEGITPFTPSEHSDAEILELFEKAGASFVIQERIRQHPLLDRLNPLSVCTIRAISLLMDNEVSIEETIIRIGGPDRLYIGENDGTIYGEILKNHHVHPRTLINTGTWINYAGGLFDDSFVVPSMDKMFDEIRRIHPRMGHFRVIGWDFAIDEDGDPVLIEFNYAPSIRAQMVYNKPFFNEKTEWILEDYFEHRKWAQNHRQNILIQ